MVFCYKVITSPNRPRSSSPRKRASSRGYISDSVIVGSSDGANIKEELWDSIPERDWKLLAALARKREEQEERERLAEEFQKMWLKEKEERQLVEAQTLEQYKQYIHEKRSHEKDYNDFKRLQRLTEQQLRRGQLMDSIRHKEQRSSEVLACLEDRKRLAIANALTSWETSLIRQEVAASSAASRACTMAQTAMKQARSARLTRERLATRERGRRLAALTAHLRRAVRASRS